MRTSLKVLLILSGCIFFDLAGYLEAQDAEVLAGCGGVFRSRAVGGISIDAAGVVGQPAVGDQQKLAAEILREMKGASQGLQQKAGERKVSLRGLNLALEDAYKNHAAVVPEEIEYLGGLQRIQYIFVYPDQSDIVLVGPGEGWKTDKNGNVVGETTGRPVLHLDDLIVALRSAHAARTEGISCSIDPTAEGRRNYEKFMSRQSTFNPGIKEGVEQALGMQQVSLTGIPEDSRFARFLVAADYRMKRYGMALEETPVKGISSYLQQVKSASANMMPRWWMACNYEPVARSEDGLAWEIRGQGVKFLTEDEFIGKDGTVKQTGKTSAPAENWANQMTEKFEELATADPVFGELRNLMDMSVVSALIAKNDLIATAGCELPMLLNRDGGAATTVWFAPKAVPTQCSYIKQGKKYVISASGGVQIESWQAASNEKMDPAIAELRSRSASATSNWWWN